MKLKTEFESLEDAVAYLKGEATDGVADLHRQVDATDRKNKELLAEKKTLTEKFKKFEGYEDTDLDDLKRRAEAAEGAGDVEAKYQSLYEKDKEAFNKRLAAIEKEREAEKAQAEQRAAEAEAARLKADAISEFSKASHNIRNPEQFWLLFGQGKIQRGEDGKPFVGDEYKQTPLGEYVKSIAEDEDNLHHFKSSGNSGSGAGGSTGTGGGAKVNPWKKDTFNLTEQGRIRRSDPQLAERLKSEAGVS